MNENIEMNNELNLQYLTFFMENQLMGIPLANVEQIVRIQTITPIPEAPPYCKGIMNLRGSIIPLVDLRLRFKKPETEYNDKTAIIVCSVQEAMIGYIVDSVDEVVRLKEEWVSPMPRVNESVATDYATGIARLPANDTTKIVLLVNVEKLQSAEDYMLMTEAGAE